MTIIENYSVCQRNRTATSITSDKPNSHYSRVFTDADYVDPASKLTSETAIQDYISEWTIFKVLDTLRPTSTGLDSVPAWFLRLGAAVFSKPLSYLFNQSLATSIVPLQWKRAIICPVPETATPNNVPILGQYICYARPHTNHGKNRTPKFSSFSVAYFTAQFDSRRPVRIPPHWINHCCCHIYLLHTITKFLIDNPYVVVIGLDFSKAFDNVRLNCLRS